MPANINKSPQKGSILLENGGLMILGVEVLNALCSSWILSIQADIDSAPKSNIIQ